MHILFRANSVPGVHLIISGSTLHRLDNVVEDATEGASFSQCSTLLGCKCCRVPQHTVGVQVLLCHVIDCCPLSYAYVQLHVKILTEQANLECCMLGWQPPKLVQGPCSSAD